jgi:hypothetical protein
MDVKSKPLFKIVIDVALARKYLETQKGKLQKDILRDQVMSELRPFLEDTEKLTDAEDKNFAEKLAVAKECQLVYLPCGTCIPVPGENGAAVEYYCDSDPDPGGREPGRVRCDLC